METQTGSTNNRNILENFEAQFKKSTFPLMVLTILSEQEQMYAYKIAQEALRRTDEIYKMPLLYTTINKLEEQGFVEESEKVITEANRTRVYYPITAEGKIYLEKLKDLYAVLNQAVLSIVYEKI